MEDSLQVTSDGTQASYSCWYFEFAPLTIQTFSEKVVWNVQLTDTGLDPFIGDAEIQILL